VLPRRSFGDAATKDIFHGASTKAARTIPKDAALRVVYLLFEPDARANGH
jgi:hypothetical protein